jgi:membrane-associated PAP2 superfamily phosphatase
LGDLSFFRKFGGLATTFVLMDEHPPQAAGLFPAGAACADPTGQ